MSKKTIEKTVMNRITTGEINMKPRWYFVLGSVAMSAGLVGLSIGAIFLVNLSFFLLRQHGPLGEWKLQLMLTTFPWWIPLFALLGTGTGIYFLKRFDFSYKNNFLLIIFAFITTIILAGFIVDYTGINDTWFGQGKMRRLYQQDTTEFSQTNEVSELSENEREYLNLALADERKALATYTATIEKFGQVKPFTNISQAEEQHISMLLELFEKYSIEVPEDTTTVGQLPESVAEVCAIGVTAEIDNDALYQKMIPEVEQEDIKAVFTSLARASIEKHLPAFQRCAN